MMIRLNRHVSVMQAAYGEGVSKKCHSLEVLIRRLLAAIVTTTFLAGEHEHEHEEGHEEELVENSSEASPGVPAILVKPEYIADAYKLRQQYRQGNTLGDAREVLSFVAVGAQVLVAAALILVTLTLVQRRKQIGALRALGAPRSSMWLIVWTELFSLFATGIALGFAVGFLAAASSCRWNLPEPMSYRPAFCLVQPCPRANHEFERTSVLTLWAKTSNWNGFVMTCMPCSRCPWFSTAFSA